MVMVASPRHGRGPATRTRRGGRPSRGGGHRARLGRPLRPRIAGRRTGHRRDRGDRLRGGRDRPRPARHGSAAPARPGRGGHRRRGRRPDALGRPVDLVVDRRRPVVELARPRPRLPRVPRARSARGSARRGCPARRGAPRARARRRDRLGAARGRDPVAVPGRRSHRAPARARRLLERARAPCGRGARARPLGRPGAARVAGRVAGLLLVYGAVLVVLLTQSRAGVVGALVVLALWLVLSDERLEDALRAVVAGRPALARRGLGVHAPGARRGRRAARRPRRRRQGVRGVDDRGRARRRSRRPGGSLRDGSSSGAAARCEAVLVGLCVLAVVVASVGLVAKVGNPLLVGELASSRAASASTTRDGSPTSAPNNRLQWWGEALDVAADRPVGGSGAGTFALARRRYRESATPVTEPHSVPLQLLADLGAVGLLLGLAVVGGAIVAARGGLRLVSGDDGAAAAALACLPARLRHARARRLRPRLPRGDGAPRSWRWACCSRSDGRDREDPRGRGGHRRRRSRRRRRRARRSPFPRSRTAMSTARSTRSTRDASTTPSTRRTGHVA